MELFNPAAREYIVGNTAVASNLVSSALQTYPNDEKLLKLKELIEQQQEQQDQQNQDQKNQDQQQQEQEQQHDQQPQEAQPSQPRQAGQMSEEEAKQLLDAMKLNEKDLRDVLRKAMERSQSNKSRLPVQKDW